jgi:hypothetical protein
MSSLVFILTMSFLFVRVLLRLGSGAAGRLPIHEIHGFSPRYVWSAAWIGFGLIGARVGSTTMTAGACLAFAFGLPEILTRLVLAPLGATRAALLLWEIHGAVGSDRDSHCKAAFQAARVLLRRPQIAAASTIEQALAASLELGPTGAAALALVALARGQRERARGVFRALEPIEHPTLWPPVARQTSDYLALDRLERGAWRELATMPARSRLARLMQAIGKRAIEPAGREAWRLWLAWALSPKRTLTRPLVTWARRRADEGATGSAAAAHAALLARRPGRARAEDVERAVAALSALRASSAVAAVQRRGLALGCAVDAGAICRAVVGTMEDEIAGTVVDERLPMAWIPGGDSAGAAIRDRVRELRLTRIEQLVAEPARRAQIAADLPEMDEWRAWGDVRSACDDGLRDASTAIEVQAVYRAAFERMTAFAVRMCNVRTRRMLAYQVFAYTLELARRAGDSPGQSLAARNVRAVKATRLPLVARSREGAITDSRKLARAARAPSAGMVAAGSALVIVFVAMVAMPPSKGGVYAYLLEAGGCVAALVALRRILKSWVDMTMTADGLELQRGVGRHIALYADVVGVSVRNDGVICVTLRRAPSWISRRPRTIAMSRSEAQAWAGRLESMTRMAPATVERADVASATSAS